MAKVILETLPDNVSANGRLVAVQRQVCQGQTVVVA
jgi:hypothetical protein